MRQFNANVISFTQVDADHRYGIMGGTADARRKHSATFPYWGKLSLDPALLEPMPNQPERISLSGAGVSCRAAVFGRRLPSRRMLQCLRTLHHLAVGSAVTDGAMLLN